MSSDFVGLVNRLDELILADQERNINQELYDILNKLSSLDLSKLKVSIEEKPESLIELIVTLISSKDETLVNKSISIISCLVTHKVSLSNIDFKKLINWLFNCLFHNFERNACEILQILQILLERQKNKSSYFWDVFLSTEKKLTTYLSDFKNRKEKGCEEIITAIVCCLDFLLLIPDDFIFNDKLVVLGNVLIELSLSNEIIFKPIIQHLNFVSATLSILRKISSHNIEWAKKNIGYLLGISRAYMLTGIPGMPQLIPKKISISQQNLIDMSELNNVQKGGKLTKTRKLRTKPKIEKHDSITKYGKPNSKTFEFDCIDNTLNHKELTSDSDFSESDSSKMKNGVNKMTEIRLSALYLIELVVKINENKTLYGYWHSIFPSDHVIPFSLLTCSTRDPHARCRIAGLKAAAILLNGSKSFLWQAENNVIHLRTFTPFSLSLGNMILTMYDQLTYGLSNENSIPVITQLLKCLSLLIQATPFHRLKSGFVPNFVKELRKLVHNKDPSVVVGSLISIEFLVSSSGITSEILNLFEIPRIYKPVEEQTRKMINGSIEEYVSDNDEIVMLSSSTSKEVTQLPWMLEIVLENFGINKRQTNIVYKPRQVSIRIESLQILIALSQHIQYLIFHLDIIATVLLVELSDPQEEIRIYSSKCLDSIAHELSIRLESFHEDIEKCKQFWMIVMPIVVEKIQDPHTNPIIKTTLCDFFSNMGSQIFESLDHVEQLKLIKFLSGVSCSEDPSVRSSSVRVLAVYALFPSMKSNLCFVENTAELILPLMEEQNLFVRIRASWSLANISESLRTNSSSDFDHISDFLLLKLLKATKESISDNDKIRSNSVRSIGNLLCLIEPKHIEELSWKLIIFECIQKLVSSIKIGNNAKVKWNTCYAIGCFIKNRCLFTSSPDFNWQKNVFDSLCFLALNNVNFKVRITATVALQKIENRTLYGDHFIHIWKSLILAMEHSDNLVDFNEYTHRDNLQEQLCFGLCHFLNIADPTNLRLMSEVLNSRKHLIRSIWIKVLNRMVPEAAGKLLCTAAMLKNISKTNKCFQLLVYCFSEEINLM
ncbi:HEATR6 family protein [Megaselia abdita]